MAVAVRATLLLLPAQAMSVGREWLYGREQEAAMLGIQVLPHVCSVESGFMAATVAVQCCCLS